MGEGANRTLLLEEVLDVVDDVDVDERVDSETENCIEAPSLMGRFGKPY